MESTPHAKLFSSQLTTTTNQALPASHTKSASLGGGFTSTRRSPFSRPESPGSPSPLRQTTPSASPTKTSHVNAASRFASSATSTPSGTAESITPRGGQASPYQATADMLGSPRAQRGSLGSSTASTAPMGHGNALSQLQPPQVRTLREGFQILDRDSDGVVNREDVADMLNQLGMSHHKSAHHYYPIQC